MAFWGTEVKPGKPFAHIFDGLKGRLHISVATLGTGTATKKSILQCNVGNKSPVYLCSLFPEKAESLQINVEFEESEEVIFSVIGPRSVHLSGYYLGGHRHRNLDDNSESYGEDIADSETQRSVNSEEDKYDDSFIDDDDPEVYPSSPVSDSGDSGSGYPEEVSNKKKPQNGKGGCRRLRKMYQLSESEMESEDEDRCPIASLKTKSASKSTTEEVEEKVEKRTVDTSSKKTEDGVFNATESIKDGDDVDVGGQSKRQFDLPVDPVSPSSEVGPENGGTPKRKRKERPKEEKSLEAGLLEKEDEAQKDEARADNRTQNLCVEDGQELKVSNNSKAKVPDNFSKPLTEVVPEYGERPKKKRRKRVEEKTCEVVSTNPDNVVKEDKGQQDESKGDMCQDLPVRSEQNQKSAKDGSSGHYSDRFVDGQSDEKKVKKKKKSKTQAHGEAVNTYVPPLVAEENADAKPSQLRTFPSGLSIEELEAGKPDGKIATSGKKICVHYVGKLKENGRVIDSTVGSAPSKFRLGQGKVIDGWDVGLDGMRVGEKRRLVIPPPMGFGSNGDGKDVPPNAWLVYDVELLKVR
ncbi:PREDICTED: peptidyl-prolyl cis-trans isomerase [Prunus dulcis]|uniref:peptidylprolyl isomerase n=1 Tax=Prunus dulcis TaxID=3755 RepID=A0A5E4FHA2_PRUDU|nr:peptidyl-prolyl cis-trans isomerase FKBP53-like [Prunus dulcis]VVA24998.1 PREDICTED: peptidyl-prolyl cis-trans isomerase [Prunus dulcis]